MEDEYLEISSPRAFRLRRGTCAWLTAVLRPLFIAPLKAPGFQDEKRSMMFSKRIGNFWVRVRRKKKAGRIHPGGFNVLDAEAVLSPRPWKKNREGK